MNDYTKPATKPIRVLLVDDQPVVRSALTAVLLIFPDLALVGEAHDGESAVQLCGLVHPDVILMDINMPGMNGIEATRHIRRQHPQIAIVALTSFLEPDLIQQMTEVGAAGYLEKDLSAQELATAIRIAHNGGNILSSEAYKTLLNRSMPTSAALQLVTAPYAASQADTKR